MVREFKFVNRRKDNNIDNDGAIKYQIKADYIKDNNHTSLSSSSNAIRTEYTSLIQLRDNDDDDSLLNRFTVFISKL